MGAVREGGAAAYVTIPKAAALTGYSANAIRLKLSRGVWIEGREWRRAPDGRPLIDMRAVEAWVERGGAPARHPGERFLMRNGVVLSIGSQI